MSTPKLVNFPIVWIPGVEKYIYMLITCIVAPKPPFCLLVKQIGKLRGILSSRRTIYINIYINYDMYVGANDLQSFPTFYG